MSDPITPPVAPVAPATEPVVPAAPTAVAPTDPPVAPAVPSVADDSPWLDPAKAEAEIKRLRTENGKDRTTAKQTAADEARTELAQKVAEALGLKQPEAAPVDPAQLTVQIEQAQAEARQTKVALAIFQNAGASGADPAALLDSASFLASVAQLDPSDPAAVTAAIQAAVTANPRLGAAPGSRLPLPNPAQGSSGSGAATLTPQQEVSALEKAGKFREAGVLKAAQLEGLRDAIK